MTVLASGISMYALALLMEKVLGWNFNMSLWLSAAIVLAYTYLGGLSSAIYNEVLQFFIILIGLLPIVILALMEVGGWSGLKEGLAPIATQKGLAPDTLTTTWIYF
jgi:SSS family solute:Na+ symporter